MRFAVIDTETTGLVDRSLPADAPGQPRLANLTIITLDGNLVQEAELDLFIKPDGWKMDPEATKIHGLTDEFLAAHGVPVKDVLDTYAALIDDGRMIVGHTVNYDLKITRGELRRAGMDDRYGKTQHFCTMLALVNVCRVPKETGRGWKWPKLSEACAHFGIEQPHAHSALGDARNTVELLRRLAEMKLLPDFDVLREAVTA